MLPLPAPTIEMLTALRNVGKYLDRVADRAPTDDEHIIARAHAIKVWAAVDRVEELALLVEELAGTVITGAPRRES